MDRLMVSLLAALLFLLTIETASGEQRAKCKTLYPPYAIAADDAQYVSDPYEEGTWDGRMFASKHSNGDDSLEMLRLSVNPGQGWPPHRHLEADEWMYVLSGEGIYSYWALEDVQPNELSIAPGHAMYNPQGQLHELRNTGTEPLVLLAVSKSLAPYEVLADWPDAPGGGLGYVPQLAPWELSCAPGHEPEEGASELLDSGDGDDAGEWGGNTELRGTTGEAGEGTAAAADGGLDDYDASPEDYESAGCGCTDGDGPMDEGAIAECMAELPTEEYDMSEYDPEAYDPEAYGDEEPEFLVDQPDAEPPARDAGEL